MVETSEGRDMGCEGERILDRLLKLRDAAYGLAARCLGGRSPDAEDVVQQAYVGALERLRRG
ncbi:MAG: hypothetical protein N3A38_00270, partial [Planctomycetota bacterium]|nr:hypothetical protein [Planctomycetota bacterium]